MEIAGSGVLCWATNSKHNPTFGECFVEFLALCILHQSLMLTGLAIDAVKTVYNVDKASGRKEVDFKRYAFL